MNKSFIYIFIIFSMILLCNFSFSAETYKCIVKDIKEGDTFVAEINGENVPTINIRLYGVDSPDEGQNFHEEGKQFLKELIGGKEVTVEVLTTDNLGYRVCKVETETGDDVSEVLVKEGYAWWDEENAKEALNLKKLCAEAIREKKGLWSDTTPLGPWDYRKSKGLPQITYKVDKKEEPKEEIKEDKKILKAKGNEVYTGTFSSANVPYIDASKINFNETKIDPNQLLMKHTPTVARDESGKPIGLAVPNINQIPYANALGFQDGDIIASVNGFPITDFSQAMPLYEKLKGVKELNVQVIRGGKPVNIPIRLP